MSVDVAVGVVIFSFVAGAAIGHWLASARWAGNAEEIHRVEFSGRLYKVYRNDPGFWHPTPDEYADMCTERRMKLMGFEAKGE